MQKRIRGIIEARLTELAEQDQVWRPEWIALEITRSFEDEYGVELGVWEGGDFWRYCGYRTVRAMVAEAIRKRTDPTKATDDQLVFEGFPRVQAYYDIKREGEWLGVLGTPADRRGTNHQGCRAPSHRRGTDRARRPTGALFPGERLGDSTTVKPLYVEVAVRVDGGGCWMGRGRTLGEALEALEGWLPEAAESDHPRTTRRELARMRRALGSRPVTFDVFVRSLARWWAPFTWGRVEVTVKSPEATHGIQKRA